MKSSIDNLNRMFDVDNLIRHIRTTHITLVIASAVLLVSLAFDQQSTADRAHRDIVGIAEIARLLNSDGLWLERKMGVMVSQGLGAQPMSLQRSLLISTKCSGDRITGALPLHFQRGQTIVDTICVYGTLWEIDTASVSTSLIQRHSDDGRLWITAPTTLKEFADIWDALGRHPMGYRLRSINKSDALVIHDADTTQVQLAQSPSESLVQLRITRRVTPDESTEFHLTGGRFVLAGTLDDKDSVRKFILQGDIIYEPLVVRTTGDYPDVTRSISVTIPVEVDSISLNPQYWLREAAGLPLQGGTFQETFPELNELIGGLWTAPIPNLEKSIRAFQRTSRPNPSIFGQQIPAVAINVAGILLVLTLQLDILLHLPPLIASVRLGALPKEPWLGVLANALWVTVGSSVLLPLAVLLSLGLDEVLYRIQNEGPNGVMNVVGFSVFGILLSAGVINAYKLWRYEIELNRSLKLSRLILQDASFVNIEFEELCRILRWLGFQERIRDNHRVFYKPEVDERICLQGDGGVAKSYQVLQVRSMILKNNLGITEK